MDLESHREHPQSNEDTLDQVKRYSEEFIEGEYPDEAPYFPIAWDNFKEILQDSGDDLVLKGPIVRDLRRAGGGDTVMAPMVIRAFYILLTMVKGMESEDIRTCKQEMLNLLSQNKFPLDFSMGIVDFLVKKGDDW